MFALALTPDAVLRPLEIWQAAEFAAHLDRAREHIRPWVGPAFVTDTVEGALATLRRYAEATAADGARIYGIWLDDTLVGGVMFVEFDAAAGRCEIGCWLEPAAEGRGLVSPAVRSLVHWAVEVRGLRRIEWHCRADNVRSSAVARRLGMRLDDERPGAWLYDGVRYDEQVWTLPAARP